MKKIGTLIVAVLLMLGFSVMLAPSASATQNDGSKRWVCKYVGTPGEDERLKDGKNPISVSSSATVGTYFNDAQGRSFVLAVQTEENTGEGNTYIGELNCPDPEGPTESPTPTPTPTETSESPTPTPTPSETTETPTPTPTPTETESTPPPPPPTESTPAPSKSTTPAAAPPDELPKTGAPAPMLAGLGSLLAALGAGALWFGRKPGLHE